MSNPSISHKYTLYFLLLLALLVGATLGGASYIALQGSRQLQHDLQEILRAEEANRQQEALEATASYLRGRLFNPVYDLNIEKLNEEISQVKAWLPVSSFLLSDPEQRILTDGTPDNPEFGKTLALPMAELRRQTALIETLPHGLQLTFSIGHGDVIAGYASVRLTGAPLQSILEKLTAANERLSLEYRLALTWLGLGSLAIMIILGVLLSLLLSRLLAQPLIQMSRAAHEFAAGRLEHRLSVGSEDELGQLARVLNQLAENLNESRQRLVQAQKIARLGFWDWQVNSTKQHWSEEIYRIFGTTPSDCTASLAALMDFVKPEDRDQVGKYFSADFPDERFQLECTIVGGDGEERVILLQGEPENFGPDAGPPTRLIGTIQDITQRKRAEEQLAYLANYDALTGLPNRYLLQDRLEHAMHQADRNGSRLALLFLDVDRFKSINDSLGHSIGDIFLKSMARRLQDIVRSSDTVARLGGDEFTLLLENIRDGDYAGDVAGKILQTMKRPFQLPGRELSVSVSIGIAIYPDDARDTESLLQHADTAMYLAKEQGRAGFRFFTSDLNRKVQEKLSLRNALTDALKNEEFSLYYQPQISLKNGQLMGVEALLRWHPTATDPAPPAQFIPVLEESDLILAVGEWVLGEACRRLRQWDQAGLSIPQVAVNLSGRQFRQNSLLPTINQVLATTGLAPQRLELEITETMLVEHAVSSPVITGLQGMGVHLAIDDFGTGYSSLSYLKRFAVDTLKIDRTFVDDIAQDQDDAAITAAIISLAHSLQLNVIAEGVESVGQLHWLKRRNCTAIQGYLVSPPLSAEDLIHWLRNQDDCPGAHRWSGFDDILRPTGEHP